MSTRYKEDTDTEQTAAPAERELTERLHELLRLLLWVLGSDYQVKEEDDALGQR